MIRQLVFMLLLATAIAMAEVLNWVTDLCGRACRREKP